MPENHFTAQEGIGMKQIVVTGGAGFIGSHLVDYLVDHTKSKIIVLDNLRRGSLERIAAHVKSGRVKFINADIRDQQAVAEAVNECDVIYHLAAQSNVIDSHQDIDYSFSTNVVGTFNILHIAQQHNVKRVLFASSREVYGQPDEIPVKESAPIHSKNAYGASKIAGEQYCTVFRDNYGLDVRVLRLANVYGPRDSGRVIPLFCEAICHGQPLTIYGGNQIIDFVWVGDVVQAMWDLIQCEVWPGTINVGSGKGITVLELANKIRIYAGYPDWPMDIHSPRSIEVGRFVSDTSKMATILGWAPEEEVLANLPQVMASYGVLLPAK